MAKKQKPESSKKGLPDFIFQPGLPRHTFAAKQVRKILEMEPWRLQKFLNSPEYELSATDQLGHGIGSRRLFSLFDIYRLGLAAHLVKEGFGYRFVAEAIQEIQDDAFFPHEDGEEVERFPFVLFGGEGSLEIRGVKRDETVAGVCGRIKHSDFYFLDFPAILAEIDQRIAAMKTQLAQKGGKQ